MGAVTVLALDLAPTLNGALVVVLGAVAVALVSAWIVRAVVSKLVTLVVLGGLALVVWTQRASLDECADAVKATLAAGAVDDTTCTFFGRQVTVSSPLGD